MMPPILVADLFPEITSHLVALLRSLSEEEWHLSTVSSRRSMIDIRITGDESLGLCVFDMVSVMA